MCGKKKCVVKRSKKEKYTVSTNQTVCCNGWEYLNDADKCGPLCSTGCVGGRCVAPDVCECVAPSYLHPDHKNTCVTPTCDHDCRNGICGRNNTCQCYDGFQTFNATHCVQKCDEGYQNDGQTLACIPTCDLCTNGTCTAPNICSCSEGYKLDGGACQPICNPSCENAVCIGVDMCSCFEGFEDTTNKWRCEPKCDLCEHGHCVGPNLCNCNEGYSNMNGTCQPQCNDSCVGGVRSAPGVCSCPDGLLKKVTSLDLPTANRSTICYKPCEGCNGTCNTKGECIPLGGCKKTTFITKKKIEYKTQKYKCGKKTCTKRVRWERMIKTPGRTACCFGWEYSDATDTCHPQCKNGCINGECIAPEECYCQPPLVLNSNYTCMQPECNPQCINAICSATNICTCNPGFSKYNTTHCAPICDQGYIVDNETLLCAPQCDRPCINGSCTAPDTCSCMDGHQLKQDDKYTCVPKCNPSCEHSDCIAPNTCSCHEGYFKESDWQCKPSCDLCDFGECVAPNQCRCHPGYSNAGKNSCEPICSRPCINGICSAPDTCACPVGYRLDEEDKYKCNPVCNPKCINSTCILPNTCSCLSGYEAENTWSCKPKCDECENGDCIAPETCSCHEGYTKEGGKCVPHCEKECSNGFCSEPDTCTCHIGYEVDNKDKFTCIPVCIPGCVNASCDSPNTCICFPGYESADNVTCKPKCGSCINGVCVGPDQCQCHEGYQHTRGICEPVCIEPCQNANCTGPGVCTCLLGYFKNDTSPSQCYKPCKGLCDMGTCTTEGICNCNSGFELNNDTCVSMRPIECRDCNSSCPESPCWCADGRPCYVIPEKERSTAQRNMATITWVFGGTLIVLLISLVCVIQWMWRKRQQAIAKAPQDDGQLYSSVIYTVPNTLMKGSSFPEDEVFEEQEEDEHDSGQAAEEKRTMERLLAKDTTIEDEVVYS